MKTTVKVTFANGDHLVTGINLSLEEAKKYYFSQPFNIGVGGYDNSQRVVKVEEVIDGNLSSD